MYQLKASSPVESETPGRARLHWQTEKSEISIDLFELNARVNFGRYGVHRVGKGKAILSRSRSGLSGDWSRSELSIVLEAAEIVEDEILDGLWEETAPGAKYEEEGGRYWGEISELPSSIREAILEFFEEEEYSEPIEETASTEDSVEQEGLAVHGELQLGQLFGYSFNGAASLRRTGDGSDGGYGYTLSYSDSIEQLRVLQSVVGMGKEYLIGDALGGNAPTTSAVIERLRQLQLIEPANHFWRGRTVFRALGELTKITGVGYMDGDYSVLNGETWIEEIG